MSQTEQYQLQPYEAIAFAAAMTTDSALLQTILIEAKRHIADAISDREWQTVVAAMTLLCESSQLNRADAYV